jgi:hypothetical protein
MRYSVIIQYEKNIFKKEKTPHNFRELPPGLNYRIISWSQSCQQLYFSNCHESLIIQGQDQAAGKQKPTSPKEGEKK